MTDGRTNIHEVPIFDGGSQAISGTGCFDQYKSPVNDIAMSLMSSTVTNGESLTPWHRSGTKWGRSRLQLLNHLYNSARDCSVKLVSVVRQVPKLGFIYPLTTHKSGQLCFRQAEPANVVLDLTMSKFSPPPPLHAVLEATEPHLPTYWRRTSAMKAM